MLCPICFNLTDITEENGVYRCDYCWGVLSIDEFNEMGSCEHGFSEREIRGVGEEKRL